MKKLFAIVLLLAMLLSLCACGKSENEIRGQISAPAESASGESAPAEEAEEPGLAEAAENVEAEAGVINGGRYESSFLGIGCELDENWTYASREQMIELLGTTSDMFNDTEYEDAIKDAEMFYDMYAAVADGTASINVLVQNLGLIYGTVLSVEQYVDLSTQSLSEQLEAAGFSDVKWEKVELDFAGETRPGLKISSQVQGIPYYCTQSYIKAGNHIAVVSFAAYFEDSTEAMLDYFFPVE